VEHADTLPMLRKAGVNFAQGFAIAEPGRSAWWFEGEESEAHAEDEPHAVGLGVCAGVDATINGFV